ncbi:SNF2 family N-terminal domain-containing protein [Jackrogersella minutella]|nr:SNF2 family N-terminal domain-containing protein [Jackrogersella minutella]
MGRTSSSYAGGGSASTPDALGLSRNGQRNGRTQSSKAACIEIEDDEDDDEDDELANEIPCSSPYFTQPTQLVSRATQPTQILNRSTLKQPSSPLVPSTPSTTIEVPASSPFQPKSQARPLALLDKKLGVASRVGSLMAPVGTSFKPPTMVKASRGAKAPTGHRGYLEISDDELLEDYKKHDSSDDDTPIRGDIRPSSFIKKEKPLLSLSNSSVQLLQEMDISLNDIRDIRLRHLTSQVYRIVQKLRPGVTIRACKEAVQKDSSWQVSKAVDILTGKATKTLSLSKGSSTSTTGHSCPGDSTNKTNQTNFNHQSSKKAPPQNSLHTFLKKLPSTTKSTTKSIESSQFSQPSRTQSSSNSICSSNTKETLPRRRLVQGRKESSTPSAVFSVSSSPTSSLTSLTNSREPSPSNNFAMASEAIANSPRHEATTRPRRRLMQGRRDKTPPPISIPSSPEQGSSPAKPSPTRPQKRRAEDESNTDILTPSSPPTKKIKTRQCKADLSDTEQGSSPAKPSPARLQKRRAEDESNPDILTSSSPPSKKTKTGQSKADLSDTKPTAQKRKAEDEPDREIAAGPNSDEEYSGETGSEATSEQFTNVLNYLNTCTTEALARMIGSAPNAKLMVSARPFQTIAAAQKVSRTEKGRSKNKTRVVAIGEDIVEKLGSWMEACEAATAIINECDKRGKDINQAMSNWAVDKNGMPRTDTEGLDELPIKKQPRLMSKSVQLKPYQLLGLNWMRLLHSKGYSGILADDMGLGKTCQVISFIAHLVESKREPNTRAPWPNLIVVPPSTYENWISEFEKFAPGVKVLAYSGKSRREISPKDARKHHVVLTTYPQVEKQRDDRMWLQKINPYAAIFDEGHRLKNQDTLIYKQMMQVPTEWRLILSGTPVQNNLKELLTVLKFIEPSLFEETSFETLNTIFETKVTSKDVLNFAALASERVDRARAVMAPFILQRRKEDVIDLAKKSERLEIVGMHETQKEIYDSIKGKYFLKNGVKAREAHPWMQLRKAAIHHQMFRHHFTDKKVDKMVDILWKKCSEDELGVQSKENRHKDRLREELMSKSDFQLHLWCKDFKDYIGHLDIPERSWEDSPKVQKLLEMVRGYMKTGDRVLVFSRFEMVIDILRETLHHAGIKYCCLTGAMDTAARFPECQEFTNNPDIPVFLLTTGAGGTGLNLTAANKIILFDQSDNPQDDVQASNRAHRIGQTRDVEVIRLITEKSVERLIYNSCVKKLVLAARVERQFAAEDEDEESVEDQCKKLMLLGDEELEQELAKTAPLTQQI